MPSTPPSAFPYSTVGATCQVAIILVDGVIPKVRRAATWLSYLNYTLSGAQPVAESPFATVCTPYVFNKYATPPSSPPVMCPSACLPHLSPPAERATCGRYRAIFGLSGSVGGQAELTYLASTYGAVKFEVPRFLDTCTGDARKIVTNHGVELVESEMALIGRIVTLCRKFVRQVPILVVTSPPHRP